MIQTIRKEILLPQPRELVWRGLTECDALADWLFPNDFVPRVGHRFTFKVPGNPKVNFDGLTVHCEVLECEPPREKTGGKLAFTWEAGALVGTQVSFRLEPDGAGTRLHFEHTGFDDSQPLGKQAWKGADYGWTSMLGKLPTVVVGLAKTGA